MEVTPVFAFLFHQPHPSDLLQHLHLVDGYLIQLYEAFRLGSGICNPGN